MHAHTNTITHIYTYNMHMNLYTHMHTQNSHPQKNTHTHTHTHTHTNVHGNDYSLASVSEFPSASTTIQSLSIAMVLATVARLAMAPSRMTTMKRMAKGTSWVHTVQLKTNMATRTSEDITTSPFCTRRLATMT